MIFEVVNRDGHTDMYTEYIQYIPTKSELASMSKEGYKFKVDGKVATKKRIIEELLKEKGGD